MSAGHDDGFGGSPHRMGPDPDGWGDFKARVVESSGWRTIDSAPKDGTRVLVSFGSLGIHRVFRYGDQCWRVEDLKNEPRPLRRYCDGDDTHWMPLPPAPQAPPKITDHEFVGCSRSNSTTFHPMPPMTSLEQCNEFCHTLIFYARGQNSPPGNRMCAQPRSAHAQEGKR